VGAALGINATAALQIVALRNLETSHSADVWAQSFGRSFLLLTALAIAALLCAVLMPARHFESFTRMNPTRPAVRASSLE
jgi:hypothetical protein